MRPDLAPNSRSSPQRTAATQVSEAVAKPEFDRAGPIPGTVVGFYRDLRHRRVDKVEPCGPSERTVGCMADQPDIGAHRAETGSAPQAVADLAPQANASRISIGKRHQIGLEIQPAGWPDRSKPLTDREKFIELGRLKPQPGHRDHASWSEWSAIQRNIWLWTAVNTHLHRFALGHANCHRLFFEDLVERPKAFWTALLEKLGILSPSTLSACIEFSRSKINRRQSYQVGRAESWTAAERALYGERARPLEDEIYG